MKVVALSDLHGQLPAPSSIPSCDLLLIAGDICPDYVYREIGQAKWLRNVFQRWVEAIDATRVYATWGNHDWLKNEWPEVMKVDELVEHDYGAKQPCRLWFSPWSNQFLHWSWMQEPDNLRAIYGRIPDCVDIIVSHQPPYGYGDTSKLGGKNLGSKELRETLDRVQPKVLLCGHIHGGYGKYRHGMTTIYNTSLVNEAYQPTHALTVFEFG